MGRTSSAPARNILHHLVKFIVNNIGHNVKHADKGG